MSGGSGVDPMLYVDISSHNGTPDLRAYWDAGYRYLMLKASEGTGYYWPQMQALAAQWHSFGLDARVGYYHWLYATFSAAAQHLLFWDRVRPVFRRGDWLMADFEDVDPSRWRPDADVLAVLREFLGLCAVHCRADVYTGNWYLANLPLCRAWLRDTRQTVVMSDYSHRPALNPYGLLYIAEQETDRAVVPGFAAPVDRNRWLIDPDGEAAAGAGIPTPVGETVDLSAADKVWLTTLVNTAAGASAHAAATLVHQDSAGIFDRIVAIKAWLDSDRLVQRVCQGVGGAIDGIPSTGHNLPGTEGVIKQALADAAARIVAAIPTAAMPAGNLQPILDELARLAEAVQAVPAETRAALAAEPLTITGSVK